MTTEDTLTTRLREQLDRATADVLGGPDLASTLVAARSRRRTRTLVRTGSAVIATAAAASVATMLSGALSTTGTAGPATGGLSAVPQDNVIGIVPHLSGGPDVATRMAATIARDLPALPVADDVYCSDWYHRGKMPQDQCAAATDWQATYTLADGHTLLVLMGYPAPYETSPARHTYDMSDYTDSDGHAYTSGFVTDDGFETTAIETVPPGGRGTLVQPGPMKGLLLDPDLHFDAPAQYVERPAGAAPTEKSPFQ